ncbi:hlyD secretion family protein [Synechococcus sp. A15-127]|uniref:HlyD family secretion protein n=1 Tax=Synechococcus sp. A15-127 TaxID=1050624 RepID=UPI00164677E7|nr:HlyD family efflux transporter periplasmic adaptor subunit [Synechococcus sp. A15-127]QNI95465.1 hlyD secretion family protein [Synechococcus sp. A15-127]
MQPWSFNQPVLLNKSRRNRSVLVWTITGTTAFAGVWAFLAPLPETVALQGKLQPATPVHEIESALDGLVAAVPVKEGASVAVGDLLVRFDPRDAETRLHAFRRKRSQLQSQIAINRVILGEESEAELTANQQQQLESQRRKLNSDISAAREALARSRTRLEGLRLQLKTAENINQRFNLLYKKGATSQLQALQAQTQADNFLNQVEAEEREVARLEAGAGATIAGSESQLRREIENNLRAITDLNREISVLEVRLSLIEVRAPISGVVFDLSISTGSVVNTASEEKPLLKIIPQDQLQAKVYIPNSAIGFIQPGQRADVAINSFPRGDFGFIPATVERIGSDALTTAEQRRVLGTEEPGLFFPAVLKLSRQTLQAGQRQVPLQPGMSLVADVHLRNRRFISSIAGGLDDRLRALERMR